MRAFILILAEIVEIILAITGLNTKTQHLA